MESLLLNQYGDSDEVEVLQALDFIGYKTDGLALEVFLNRRPDVESWLYKVSRLTLGPCVRLVRQGQTPPSLENESQTAIGLLRITTRVSDSV